MFDKQLVATVLDLKAPWKLHDIKLDADNRRLDVWIGCKSVSRNWFGGRRDAVLPEKTWRHLNTMNTQTWVHITPPIGARLDNLPWAGDDTQPFTHAMAAQLLSMMDSGLSLEAIGRIFDISVNDLWRYSYAIESRKSGTPAVSTPPSSPCALRMQSPALTGNPASIAATHVFRRA